LRKIVSNERPPLEMPSARMEPLARVPVFFALGHKRVVVAGGSPGAAWKAELLSAAGADVNVFAPEACEELTALAADPPGGSIVIHARRWEAGDFAGAAMAVGACENEEDAARFAEAARRAGVPVNVIDKPAFCDFAFGAIVNRSPLVIGISTDGAAPVFGMAIRAKLEAMIPRGFARWSEAARRWRSTLQHSGLSFAGRRQFWRAFTKAALAHPDHEPVQADYDTSLADTLREGAGVDGGSVILVGAGPGDPELLTLRAVRALQSADVILFDDLVSRDVLDFSRREAKKMLVGKRAQGPSCRQSDINALMVSLAASGKRVVRLKGGDPMIFGRAGEEIEACRRANVPVEVVPGITAAQGAASRLGLSLTQRRTAQRLQYLTGHGEDGGLPQDVDWRSVADPGVTTIVYMPSRTLPALAARAIAEGLDPATPALAIARATRPDQETIVTTIAELAARLAADKPKTPLLVIIGKVVAEQHITASASLADRALDGNDRGAVGR
jgi:uroporphyrin-III C-methyltransferase/precorrin-2 dehydrogenase/sirohydrochlorin ferrochelatase